ncbi:MAG TPA: hypothetical protein ENK57_12565 [Polyangiaceae bacterium]|nr:hypothetical protein [Polyangiaceae bacterium]
MPSHRGLGRRGVVLLAVLLGALVGWVALAGRRGGGAASGQGGSAVVSNVLEHVPADAFLVAEIDVDRLRATELGRRLLGDGREVAGLGEIQALCGRDPMNAVRRLVIAVPEADEVGFGLFADGVAISAEAMLGCAERIVAERGGKPRRTVRGRFGLLEDEEASVTSARLAVADGGPLVLGEPPYVDASLRLAEGEGTSLAGAGQHAELRERLEGDVVVATAVLSAEQRATLRQELRMQNMADSPFRSVSAAGLGARVGRDLSLHAVLVCDDATAAQSVAAVIDEARRGEAETPAAVVSGLNSVLGRLVVGSTGNVVQLRLRLPVDDALQLVQRLLALRRLAQQRPAPIPSVDPTPAPGSGGARPAVSMERLTPAPAASSAP